METIQADTDPSLDPLILELEALVESGALSTQASAVPVENIATAELSALLPRYRVGDLIGAGGMGQVYDAHDTLLHRRVAIKVVRRPGPLVADLMRREREVLAALDHQGIVAVYDCGELAQGQPYYVMQYVEGEELLAYTASHQLSRTQAIRLMAETARAVGVAHLLKVVHRDLKPSNIKVTSGGRPMILDFGLAKFTAAPDLDPACPAAPQRCQSVAVGKVKGTLAYMSPEQAAGENVDSRTDVYALGVILHELLTGRLPRDPKLEGSTPLDWGERLRSAPSSGERFDERSMPWALRAIVNRCLALDPEQRYATASELADDLEAYLDRRNVSAVRRYRSIYVAGMFALRHRRAIAIASVILTTLAAVVVLSFARIRAERNLAESSAKREMIERRRAIDRENATRRLLYAADIGQAHRLWHNQQVDKAQSLLDRYQPEPGAEDLRTFEWRVLARLCRNRPMTLTGHNANVTTVVYSPDGVWLATGDAKGQIHLWDAEKGEPALTFRAHGDAVKQLGFSADSRLVFSLGNDRALRLWDAATGKQRANLAWWIRPLAAAAFSPDGQRLASVDSAGWIYIWDANTQKVLRQVLGHPIKGARSLAFSTDGKLLASGGKDQTARVWDATTLRPVAQLGGHLGPIDGVSFSRDGGMLVTGGTDRFVRVWRIAEPESPQFQWFGADEVVRVGFGESDDTVWAAYKNGTVVLLNWRGGQVRMLNVDAARLDAVSVTDDWGHIATTSGDRTVKIWSAGQLDEYRQIRFAKSFNPGKFAFSQGGDLVAICDSQGPGLEVWTADSRQHLTSLAGIAQRPTSLAFVRKDRALLVLGAEGALTAIDLQTGQSRPFAPASGKLRLALIASPIDARCAVADANGGVEILDSTTGRKLASLKGHENMPIVGMAFSPDGQRLATTGWDKTLHIWNVDEGSLHRVLRGHQGTVNNACFSPDGSKLASTSADGTVRLWNCDEGAEVTTLWRQPHETIGICFSPDGQTLAASNSDPAGTGRSQIRMWNLRTLQETLTLEVGASQIAWLGFAPDGERLLATIGTGLAGAGMLIWEADQSAPTLERP